MTTPRVRPPAPDGELIASWLDGWMRLVDLGDGAAAVVVTRRGERLHVADVAYGAEPTVVRWNIDGAMEIQQYKRDAWESRIYPAVARWRAGQ